MVMTAPESEIEEMPTFFSTEPFAPAKNPWLGQPILLPRAWSVRRWPVIPF